MPFQKRHLCGPWSWGWWLETDFLLLLIWFRFCFSVFLLFIGFVHFLMNKLFCHGFSSHWCVHMISIVFFVDGRFHIFSLSPFIVQINTKEMYIWSIFVFTSFWSAATMNPCMWYEYHLCRRMSTNYNTWIRPPKFYDSLNFSFWWLEFHFEESLEMCNLSKGSAMQQMSRILGWLCVCVSEESVFDFRLVECMYEWAKSRNH